MSDAKINYILKDLLVPIFTAVFMGTGASVIALKTMVSYMEADINAAKERLATAVVEMESNTSKLVENTVKIKFMEIRLEQMEYSKLSKDSAMLLKYEILSEVNNAN